MEDLKAILKMKLVNKLKTTLKLNFTMKYLRRFLAPTGAQGATLSVRPSVCLSVCPGQSAHSSYFWLISSSRLQNDFMMTSG